MSPLHKLFLDKLDRATQERPKRSGWAPRFDGTSELEWITYERSVMLEAVNQARHAIGRAPVTVNDVMRVENTASGHCDYVRKFALYCAEMVMRP